MTSCLLSPEGTSLQGINMIAGQGPLCAARTAGIYSDSILSDVMDKDVSQVQGHSQSRTDLIAGVIVPGLRFMCGIQTCGGQRWV